MKKPKRVADHYLYWTDPPPEISPRCAWWAAEISAGRFRPNQRVRRMGYDPAAEFFGVYIWEYLNVLRPLLDRLEVAANASERREA